MTSLVSPPPSRALAFAMIDIIERDLQTALRDLARLRRGDPNAGLTPSLRERLRAARTRLDLALKGIDAMEAPMAKKGRSE